MRRPLTPSASLDASQTTGARITTGWMRASRSRPASSEMKVVLVAPPGMRTFAVTPEPSSCFAMMAMNDSWADFDGP